MANVPGAVSVPLPPLGDSIVDATLARWLVAVGDPVADGEPLCELATDKVEVEVPSPVAGTVTALAVAEGESIAVGDRLATVSRPEPSRPAPPPPDPSTSPDVAPAQRAAAPSTRGARTEKLPRIRQMIARRMTESLQTTAQLTTVFEVDVTAIAKLRADHRDRFHRRTGTKLTFLPFFLKASAQAIAEHPVIGASVDDACTEVTYPGSIDIGIAVDSPRGLMVPVIKSADELSISELAVEISTLADTVREGRATADMLTGGVFTVTNTGSRGALFDTPILNRPQSAILGTGTVADRAVGHRQHSGSMGFTVRSIVHLALSYDHRLIDGADASRFLTTVKNRLEGGFSQADLE